MPDKRFRAAAGRAAASLLLCLAAAAGPARGATNFLKDALWRFSTDGGRTFTSSLPRPERTKSRRVLARAEFRVLGPSFFDRTKKLTFVSLQMTVRKAGAWTAQLNGHRIRHSVDGVNYRTVHGIDPKWIRKGENNLLLSVTLPGAGRKHKGAPKAWQPQVSLSPLYPADLKFHSGPVLGAAGEGLFSVTCRTNLPAEVRLELETAGDGPVTRQTSRAGLFHRFRVAGLTAPWKRYKLTASHGQFSTHVGAAVGRGTTDPPGAMRFIAAGDSRTNPAAWAKVAAAIGRAGPEFVVFSGDMVADGRNDWEWNEQFLGPGKDLLASVPLYAVIGNHEKNSPLFEWIFLTPTEDGRGLNWSQTIRYVQIIGIDGAQDWSRNGRNARWLDRTLAGSNAKFVFLFSHYPAWTSSSHGKLGSDGQPRERSVRQAREVIMPLLVKHKATAMITGHDHCYERSQPDGGVTHIISGGAGAPLRGKASNARKQNPHSKVFASVLHYCMFDLNGEVCTMRVLTPDARKIDEHTWEFRPAEGRAK